jgi:hypothetical protein
LGAIIIITIIRRNGAKTRSPQNFVWGFNRKRCKNNKSPNFVWGLNNNNKKQSKNNMSHKLLIRNYLLSYTNVSIFDGLGH